MILRAAVDVEHVVLRAGERRRAVVSVIDAARTRISFSVYRFDDPVLLDALSRARARGVEIEVLVSSRVKRGRRARRGRRDTVESFDAAGFRVREYIRGVKYHAKFLVADDRTAVVTSMNFTPKCFERTSDFVVVTRDRRAVAELATLFRHDFAREAFTAADDSCLVIGPDGARARYAALLSSARHSIRIMDHKLSDTAILALLERKARQGVRVRIIGRERRDAQPHGKLLIVDGRTAVVGSIALSAASLDGRRELGIRLDHPRHVAELTGYFDRALSSPRRPRVEPDGLYLCEAV